MAKKKILVIPGSARSDSINKKLAAVAAHELGQAGAEVSLIDLADFEAPLYNGDIEAESGIPATMKNLKKLISTHDAIFLVTPVYNSCLPPLVINCFSWVSRPDGEDNHRAAFAGKLAAIASASPGSSGGMTMIPRARDYLAELGCMTIPGFASVPGAYDAFDEEGNLTADRSLKQLRDLATRLVRAA